MTSQNGDTQPHHAPDTISDPANDFVAPLYDQKGDETKDSADTETDANADSDADRPSSGVINTAMPETAQTAPGNSIENGIIYQPEGESAYMSKAVSEPSLRNIWGASKELKKMPKPKYKWGLIEVICAGIIFLITQIAFSIVLTIIAVGRIGDIESLDVADKLQDEVLKLAYTPVSIVVSSALMYASWLIMMWYSSRYRGEKSWAKDFGLKFKKIDIVWGLGLAALAFGLMQGISAVLSAMGIDMEGASNTAPFTSQSLGWRIALFIGMVSLIGPFMEELFFRGFLLRGLLRAANKGESYDPSGPVGYFFANHVPLLYSMYFSVIHFVYKFRYIFAAVISSVVFGMMHLQGFEPINFVTVGVTALLGLMFAIVAMKTKRLGPSMIAHMGYNGTVAVITLLTMGAS